MILTLCNILCKRKNKYMEKKENLFAPNTKWIKYLEYLHLNYIDIPQK